ncbi:RNA polymerase factor sigma-54 [Desulfovibrio sp. OttesenSCG-928-C14]|nr:RNA polymerase factor sigma-54 [Desulfovibrio sp. OttesenSCG-928-C14]
MPNRNFAAIAVALDGQVDTIVSLQRAMTDIPAIGPENNGSGEAAKAAYLKTYISQLGLRDIREFNAPDLRVPDGFRPNLAVRLPGKTSRTLWIIGHMDVVPPGEEFEKVLASVQRFDPVGVAARTPQECLLVQVGVLGYDRDPVLVSLIRDHLEDLEARRYKPLMRKFKLGPDDLREYLEIIQTLDPVPGASFGDVEPNYVAPDVYVYKYEGDFFIVLNDEGLPQLQLSSLYGDSLAVQAGGKDKDYFQERMRSAAWLIKSLHQRQRTLYKVMESIVKHQRDFFEEGPARLRPLILKEIAEDVGMHESTISRVTSNKYAATPYGVFELKYFFNSSLALADGNEVGSESVKVLIKKYIAEEDHKAPLSDEKIVEMLQEALSLNIARRTVAKYRTALGIPSSSKRKEVL